MQSDNKGEAKQDDYTGAVFSVFFFGYFDCYVHIVQTIQQVDPFAGIGQPAWKMFFLMTGFKFVTFFQADAVVFNFDTKTVTFRFDGQA